MRGDKGAEARAAREYREKRMNHWDRVGRMLDTWTSRGGYYHERLARVYRYLVPPGLKVIEIGCGLGDLLASLEPSDGVGVDFSGEMIRRAEARHPKLRFIQCDAHDLCIEETFDVVILSDVVNDLDVQAVFERVSSLGPRRGSSTRSAGYGAAAVRYAEAGVLYAASAAELAYSG